VNWVSLGKLGLISGDMEGSQSLEDLEERQKSMRKELKKLEKMIRERGQGQKRCAPEPPGSVEKKKKKKRSGSMSLEMLLKSRGRQEEQFSGGLPDLEEENVVTQRRVTATVTSGQAGQAALPAFERLWEWPGSNSLRPQASRVLSLTSGLEDEDVEGEEVTFRLVTPLESTAESTPQDGVENGQDEEEQFEEQEEEQVEEQVEEQLEEQVEVQVEAQVEAQVDARLPKIVHKAKEAGDGCKAYAAGVAYPARGPPDVRQLEWAQRRTERGGAIRLFKNYEFILQKINPRGSWRWTCRRSCTQEKCKAGFTSRPGLEGDVLTKEEEMAPHNHGVNIERSNAVQLKERLKVVAVQNQAAPRNLVAAGLGTLSHLEKVALRDTGRNLANAIRKFRRKDTAFERPPEGFGFVVPEKFNDMLLFDSAPVDGDNRRILIFGSQRLLEKLKGAQWWVADGTFKACPPPFRQLYTVHARVNGTFPPCLFAFLPNKRQVTYEAFWGAVRELVTGEGPQQALLDFEQASLNGFRSKFDDSEVKGCFFHFCQAIIKRVAELGLKKAYFCRESKVRLSIKSLMALSTVPEEDVVHAFETLLNSDIFPGNDESDDEDDERRQREAEKMQDLVSSVERTYIRGRNNQAPRFAIELWNTREAALTKSPRTTNGAEGWHSSVNRCLTCKPPSLWKSLQALQGEIQLAELSLANMYTAVRARQISQKAAQKADDLANACRQYNRNDIMEYLQAVAIIADDPDEADFAEE